MFLTKTYSIQDCTEYDTLTTDKQKYTVTSGSATLNYSSDGLLITGTVASDTVISNSLVLPSEYTAELDVNFNASGWSGSIVFEDMFIALDDNSNKLYFFKLSSNTQISSISNFTTNTGTLKIKRTGTTIEVYLNGNLIQTLTNISTTNKYGFRTYNGRTLRVKNLKIKPL